MINNTQRDQFLFHEGHQQQTNAGIIMSVLIEYSGKHASRRELLF